MYGFNVQATVQSHLQTVRMEMKLTYANDLWLQAKLNLGVSTHGQQRYHSASCVRHLMLVERQDIHIL